jgi:hypothetical protein
MILMKTYKPKIVQCIFQYLIILTLLTVILYVSHHHLSTVSYFAIFLSLAYFGLIFFLMKKVIVNGEQLIVIGKFGLERNQFNLKDIKHIEVIDLPTRNHFDHLCVVLKSNKFIRIYAHYIEDVEELRAYLASFNKS